MECESFAKKLGLDKYPTNTKFMNGLYKKQTNKQTSLKTE